MCLLVSCHSHETYACLRNEGTRLFDHAEARSQDRYQERWICQPHSQRGSNWRLDVELFHFCAAHGLVDQHMGQSAQGGPERCVVAASVAHGREQRRRQRMVDNSGVHGRIVSENRWGGAQPVNRSRNNQSRFSFGQVLTMPKGSSRHSVVGMAVPNRSAGLGAGSCQGPILPPRFPIQGDANARSNRGP